MSRAALLGLALLSAGCAGTPRRVLGSPDVITRPPVAAASLEEAFGRQVRVDTSTVQLHGELVACDEAFLYLHLNVVTDNPDAMVPWPEVSKAEVRLSTSNTTTFVTWSVLGTLSAATHGIWGAIVSGPVWLASGIPSAIWGSSKDYVTGKCAELGPYARYPQGLPELIRQRFWGSAPPVMTPMPGPGGPIPPGMRWGPQAPSAVPATPMLQPSMVPATPPVMPK